MLCTPTGKLVFQATDPFTIRNLLPDASRLCTHAAGNIVVRHTPETTLLLRNLGFEVPSPIRAQYSWPGKYKPFDHQEIMADAMTVYPKVFNLSEMGTGKTYATLWAADYLMEIGAVKRALVIAPSSTLDIVWQQDIFDILMHRNATIVRGGDGAAKREKQFNIDAQFYIMNHDAIGLEDVAKLVKRRTDIDLVILDEASDFRNPSTRRYKYLRWALEKKPRFWAISGTPTPNGPDDAWAMSRIVNPDAVPPHHGTFKRQTMTKVSDFKWVPKRGSEALVHEVMQPAVRFAKKDCLSLPPVVTIKREAAMSVEQKNAYELMRKEMSLRWASGDRIDAVNAADQIAKLRQILCGVVKIPETDTYRVLDYKPRFDLLMELIGQAKAKVIVVVPFKGIIQHLEKDLQNQGISVGMLNGDVPVKKRSETVRLFKTTANPQLLLCHPKVMSHGLNLVEADMTIFYGPIYSADQYRQVIERNNRTGQVNNMTVARMGIHPLDWKIYQAVDNRGITQDNILKLYQQVIA